MSTRSQTVGSVLDAEERTLGVVMQDASTYDVVRMHIDCAERFSLGLHRQAWSAIEDLIEAGQPCNVMLVANRLASKGVSRQDLTPVLMWSADTVPAEAASYARIVKQASVQRSVVADVIAWAQTADRGINDLEAWLRDRGEDLHAAAAQLNTNGRVPGEVLSSREVVMALVEAMQDSEEGLLGLQTGLEDLDALITGIQDTDLVIIGGRPGMGKSALALDLSRRIARRTQADAKARKAEGKEPRGVGVLFFSLEMGADQIGLRYLSSESGVPMNAIRRNTLTDANWSAMLAATAKIARDEIHYVDSVSSLTAITTRIRKMHAETPLAAVVIDYLQLVEARAESRHEAVAQVSRRLKGLARELRLPIIALAQLNRGVEQRADKRPMMSDLRESGQIEQDADIIAFVYRDEYYNEDTEDKNITEVIVVKARSGEPGMARLRHDLSRMQYRSERTGWSQ